MQSEFIFQPTPILEIQHGNRYAVQFRIAYRAGLRYIAVTWLIGEYQHSTHYFSEDTDPNLWRLLTNNGGISFDVTACKAWIDQQIGDY